MKRLLIATVLTSSLFLTACEGETSSSEVENQPISYEGGSLSGQELPSYEQERDTEEKHDTQQLRPPTDISKDKTNNQETPIKEQEVQQPSQTTPPRQNTSQDNQSNHQHTPAAKKPVHTTGQAQKIPAEFVRVVDGDTARFMYDGQEVAVRYLLIDTPESKSPRVGWQPYGREASDYNERLLKQAKQTYLEFDVGDRKDRYGRLLAYIWADDILVNEQLVREGYAIKAYVYPPNTRYLSRIEQAQRLAKQEGKNVWSLKGFVSNGDFVGGSKIDGNKNFPQYQ